SRDAGLGGRRELRRRAAHALARAGALARVVAGLAARRRPGRRLGRGGLSALPGVSALRILRGVVRATHAADVRPQPAAVVRARGDGGRCLPVVARDALERTLEADRPERAVGHAAAPRPGEPRGDRIRALRARLLHALALE